MTAHSRPPVRTLARAAHAACLAVAILAVTVGAADEPSPSIEVAPDASASPMLPEAGRAAPGFPLPDVLGDPSELPTVSIEPASEAGWVVGVAQPYALGHCGILSPVDLDGSLWAPLGGTDAAGGPIDRDQEIGELINATSGRLELTTDVSAVFVSDSGQRLYFGRAPDALHYFLCM